LGVNNLLKKETIDLLPFLQDVAIIYQSQASSVGVTITVTVAANLPVLDIDPVRMRQVLANLLAN
jgi:signal transduction histidine kinase